MKFMLARIEARKYQCTNEYQQQLGTKSQMFAQGVHTDRTKDFFPFFRKLNDEGKVAVFIRKNNNNLNWHRKLKEFEACV